MYDKQSDELTYLDAMIQIESGGKNGIMTLDTNKKFSYGVLQIQQPYLDDANQYTYSHYETKDVQWSPEISKRLVQAYIEHYARYAKSKISRELTLREQIALHNGGPNGYTKENALAYADKVLAKLEEMKQTKAKEQKT